MKLEVMNLTHEYGNGFRALDGVSCTFKGAESVAIIGQNGSGKTTLVKHFNGMLAPTSGKILIDDVDVTTRSTAQWSSQIGYVFQNPDDQLFLESVQQEFMFGPIQMGLSADVLDHRLEVIAKLVGLDDKLDVHPFDLSPTEKKFCTIGSVLMMQPKVVIFDEPTCGQDVKGNRRLHNIVTSLRKQGILCITISHDMKFVVKNFSRVVVMCSGKVLLDGETSKVFTQVEQLKRSFIEPPPITRVAQKIGIKNAVFTPSEFIKLFNEERKYCG